jgi:hypothetical protein
LRFRDILIYALLGAVTLSAQQTQQLVQAAAKPEPLKINVLEGEGGKNNIKTRVAVAPVIEVKDSADKPVSGAEVVFQLPLAGPGGAFNGWLRTQTVRTDAAGKASVTGYTPNMEPGRFNIKVTATSGASAGQVIIAQVNIENGEASAAATAAGGKGKGPMSTGIKKAIPWKFIGPAIGAAAIGGIAAAVRGGNGNTTTTAPVPVTISAGSVGVGVPR